MWVGIRSPYPGSVAGAGAPERCQVAAGRVARR
jgi:hypothetical protein